MVSLVTETSWDSRIKEIIKGITCDHLELKVIQRLSVDLLGIYSKLILFPSFLTEIVEPTVNYPVRV